MLGLSFLAAGGVMSEQEVKRVLGVGMATFSDHLREYKDPFEPGDSKSVASADINFKVFVLSRKSTGTKSLPP